MTPTGSPCASVSSAGLIVRQFEPQLSERREPHSTALVLRNAGEFQTLSRCSLGRPATAFFLPISGPLFRSDTHRTETSLRVIDYRLGGLSFSSKLQAMQRYVISSPPAGGAGSIVTSRIGFPHFGHGVSGVRRFSGHKSTPVL